ncbi:uncharacterized protein LOC128501179 [Spea bombifrons]|uniref:uncharacterized protein LOC128501179 n=1 Tax=Spea bombifrons TaxID=233779 RepID=UPI0023494DDF|nr:uncharacterized protein LOC128501179 [Spea bombifrons]
MTGTKKTVGIFSRDNEVSYRWLVSQLRSSFFHNVVKEVRAVTITNNQSKFLSELSGCTFAILYHTQHRGRLNVANVADALYDDELDKMCRLLGRENVIVLLDDLEDSSQAKRMDILNTQYDILTKACELFLISTLEKKSCNLYGSDPRWSKRPTSPQLQGEYLSIRSKRKQIRDIISPDQKGDFSDDDSQITTSTFNSHGRRVSERSFSDNCPQTDTLSSGSWAQGQGTVDQPLLINTSPGLHPIDDSEALRERQVIPIDSKGPAAPKRRKILNLSNKAVFLIIGVIGGILLIAFIVIVATL